MLSADSAEKIFDVYKSFMHKFMLLGKLIM